MQSKVVLIEQISHSNEDIISLVKEIDYQCIVFNCSDRNTIPEIILHNPDIVIIDVPNSCNDDELLFLDSLKKEINFPILYIITPTNLKFLQNIRISEQLNFISKPVNKEIFNLALGMALNRFDIEQRLKLSEEKYRLLVESSPIAIGIHCEGRVVFANRAALDLFGAENSEQFLNLPVMDLVVPEYKDDVIKRTQAVLQEKRSAKLLHEKFIRLDGKIIDVEVVAIYTTFMGKPAVQVSIRDITEIKRKETIQDATLKILNASNNSKSLEELFGYIHKTLIGIIGIKNFFIALADEDNKTIKFVYYSDEYNSSPKMRSYGKGLTELVIQKGESLLINENKLKLLIQNNVIEHSGRLFKTWLGIPLKVNKKIIGVLALKEYNSEMYLGKNEKDLLQVISFPISRAIERKIVEEERTEYIKKLKELNTTKDKFFSLVSHDLRSPFNSILGFVQLLRDEYSSLTEEEIKQYTSFLYNSTHNVFNLLNNLLQFSRFQLGLTKYEPQRIKLSAIVEDNVKFIKASAVQKGISIENFIDDGIEILAEKDMIDSVLRNLITNAIKFTDQNGSIKLRASLLNGFVKISVEDNGVGINESDINKLFKIENKNSTRGTNNEEGTGLGLILTKEFVEKHGGKIFVTSKLGEGTSVSFTIPAT